MADPIFLSVIIPAHNEERRLPGSLESLHAFLAKQPFRSEVIVVENGSADQTASLVKEFSSRYPEVRLLQTTSRGKGLAVRLGMLHARGTFRFLCDADFSMPVEEMSRFLPPSLADADIAIGSREVPGSIRINEPAFRHVTGRIFSLAVKVLIMRGFEDTQCGFKCFRQEAAEYLFSRQRFDGWSFDVEVLFLARKKGFRIREVPISWKYQADSRIRLAGDSIAMFVDLLKIRWNAMRGIYESPNPSAMARP